MFLFSSLFPPPITLFLPILLPTSHPLLPRLFNLLLPPFLSPYPPPSTFMYISFLSSFSQHLYSPASTFFSLHPFFFFFALRLFLPHFFHCMYSFFPPLPPLLTLSLHLLSLPFSSSSF